MNQNESDELPSIDMTSQADQEFMDADVEPGRFDPVEHYEQTVEYFEERGWDTDRLDPPDGYESSDPSVGKADTEIDLETVEDCLHEAVTKAVFWQCDADNPDLSKSPGVWQYRSEVPDYVLEKLEEIIERPGVVWSDYDELPPTAQAEIREVLEEHLLDPDGFTLGDIVDDLHEHYPDVDEGYLESTLRNETGKILNTAKEEAFEEAEGPDEEFVYDWVGPSDHRTTDCCEWIQAQIEDAGGAVPMERLKEILLEAANRFEDDGGTPSTAEQFAPHHQCRRTVVRRVQSI